MKKVYLIILDGFGLGHHDRGDAIYNANKPFLQKLFDKENFARLKTDGEAVGLPSFQMGGSEAGHLSIGAGRPVKQFLTKINEDDFLKNKQLVELFEKAKSREKIHFTGLISDGGIHSFLPHLLGLLDMAKSYGIKEIYIHGFTDGRDVGERSALKFITQIEEKNIGKIASIGGRFYAMDRDSNWERVLSAYNAMTGDCKENKNPAKKIIEKFYEDSDKSDYYLPPQMLDKSGAIQAEDVVISFNYRIDRMRQLWRTFCDKNFAEFSREFILNPKNLGVFGTYYDDAIQVYKEEKGGVKNTLGEVISRENLDQLRISETEKYNHVTFYFSGGRKEEFKNEERILIPSPKCASYAEKPAMSAPEQTEAVIKRIDEKDFSFVVQNFANSDLVGHSGKLDAAIEAIEVVDSCLSKLVPKLLEKEYSVIITADHGNSDEMLYPNGDPCASHTKNLVPMWVLDNSRDFNLNGKKGTLADISPTVLKLLEIKKPAEMTGNSLV